MILKMSKLLENDKDILAKFGEVAKLIKHGTIAIRLERLNAKNELGVMVSIQASKLNNDKGVIPALLLTNEGINAGYVNVDYAAQIGLYEVVKIAARCSSDNNDIEEYDKLASELGDYEAYIITQPQDIVLSLGHKPTFIKLLDEETISGLGKTVLL